MAWGGRLGDSKMLSRGASVGVDKELKNILRCRMGMSLCSNSKKYDSVKSASLSSNFRGENLGSEPGVTLPCPFR